MVLFQLFSYFSISWDLVEVVLLKPFLFCSFGFWLCFLVVGVKVLHTVGHSFDGPF